jgi:hypothetical protein
MPRITIGFIILALVFYFIGAKWPVLAQKVGLV